MFHANGNQKTARRAILTSDKTDKTDFKTRAVIRDEGHFIMTRGSRQQADGHPCPAQEADTDGGKAGWPWRGLSTPPTPVDGPSRQNKDARPKYHISLEGLN